MPAVNQRIPNFLGGVSQQPDKIKFPGQLRVCDNAVPDITFGLKKRPPAEFVGTLSGATSTGHWYEILRDGDEKYLVQITENNLAIALGMVKPIRVWDLADGTEKSLTNSNGDSLFAYLADATAPYAITTIQDYTLIANPQKTVGTTGITAAPIHGGDYSYARLDTVAYNTEYILYSGSAPTPNTYYRVTSVKVDRMSGGSAQGPTFDDTNEDQSKSGTLTWSFSGGSAVTTGATNCENIEGSLQVNGNSYIANNTATYQGNQTSDETKFLGYVQDYDVRYTATVTLQDGGLIKETNKTTAENKFIDVTMEGETYRISVEAVEPVITYQDVSGIAYFKTPKNPDNGTISMATILQGLQTSVNHALGLANVTAEVIGSGLFLYGSEASGVNFLGGAVNENMSVIGQKAQDISRLPAMCKQGYVAQVSNAADLDTDDYYVEFQANNGVSGSGSWEETVRPNGFTDTVQPTGTYSGSAGSDTLFISVTSHGYSAGDEIYLNFTGGSGEDGIYNISLVTNSNTFTVIRTNSTGATSGNVQVAADPMILGLDPATMPHALVNNRDGTFTFKKLDEATKGTTENYWKNRVVGDNISNPFPTFNGSQIQQMFFHRNRLGMISGEQIVLSQPGQYFNFGIVSAISASDDNPIDITVSDVKPAFINHTLPINKGLMMFSDNGQFMLFTESDIFSPKTARLKKIASYECDASIQPVDLGTSILFTSNVSAYARAFEATIVDDDTPPNIIEQTRVVPEFLPKDITKSTNSAAIGITTYGKKGDTRVYHYKYYNAGNQREQSAWYSWTLTGTLQHMLYTGGSFFTVTLHDGSYKLCKHEYVADANANRTYVLGGDAADVGSPIKTARWFEPCLDNIDIASNVAGSAQTVSNTGDVPEKTVLRIKYVPANTTDLFMVGLSGNDSDGNSISGTVRQADAVGSETIAGVTYGTVTFNNINLHSAAKVAVGYKYTSIIELPTYYLNVGQNAYDLDGELRISGINFEMGVSGPMQFHLTPQYADMDSYTQFESGMLTNSSNFDKPPATLEKSVRVPIQKKNEKYTLQIQIPDPFSTALISASWDGNYNTKRHVRR
jgi:hypothetical protein